MENGTVIQLQDYLPRPALDLTPYAQRNEKRFRQRRALWALELVVTCAIGACMLVSTVAMVLMV